jgi:chromosomal replication initiator protein
MNHDARKSFDTFVVGPANRLAFAAARRAAESPGASYNPLFLYSASGLGKSHILSAIAQQVIRGGKGLQVVYQTVEGFLEDLTRDLELGGMEGPRFRYSGADILLLDDVQFLTGQGQAQEMLLRTLDDVAARKGQVVLASDRPPAEINGLDDRLLSRFSGGLIVDMGQPDYETRVAIAERKVGDQGARLGEGVTRALARYPFRNVRELQGALNRILAVQDLEERMVEVGELPSILGGGEAARVEEFRRVLEGGEAGGGGTSLEALEGSPPPEGEWRRAVREAAEAVEVSGFSAHRLRALLERPRGEREPEGWRTTLDRFHVDVERVRALRRELDDLGNPWPDAAAQLLRDPDRLEDAESLLASARERARPFPDLPPGPGMEGWEGEYPPLAIRAAERVLAGDRPEYNPLFLHSPTPGRARALLEAVGRTFQGRRPSARIGFISVEQFSEEFIRAISAGVAGAWRERWWTVDLLLLHGVEGLSGTERSQEEFFHLFEALKRRGARVLLAGDRPPSAIQGVDDRLRSRFEGGLVVELGRGREGDPPTADVLPAEPASAGEGAPAPPPTEASAPAVGVGEGRGPSEGAPGAIPPSRRGEDVLVSLRALVGLDAVGGGVGGGDPVDEAFRVEPGEGREGSEEGKGGWFPSPEKVVWNWPRPEDRIVDERAEENLP